MKAAVLRGFNNIQIEELELPELGVGQVLVKVLAATICGAQINEITGAKGPDRFLPHLLGHEGCGTVIDVGLGVSTVKVGQTVVMHWRKGLGIEAKPPKYLKKINNIEYENVGAGPISTFAETAIFSENRLTAIQDDIDPVIASLFGCAVTTGLGLINNEAQLKIGQSIAVAGVGGVGLNVIQGAAMVSAYPIIAIDKEESKLRFAELFGATHTFLVQTTLGDFFNKDRYVDVFVDCTGSPSIISESIDVLNASGRLILVGQVKSSQSVFFKNSSSLYKNRMIIDSQGGQTNPNVDIPRYIQLYKERKLKLDRLVTHRFKLEQINEAIDLMKTGKAGRIALEMI